MKTLMGLEPEPMASAAAFYGFSAVFISEDSVARYLGAFVGLFPVIYR